MERNRILHEERGNVTVFIVMAAMPMALALAFAITFTTVYVVRCFEANDLNLAREQMMLPSFGLQLKNTDDAQVYIATTIIDSLRRNGTDARVDIYVCESEDPDIPDCRRAIAFYAIVTERHAPVTLSGLLPDLPIGNAIGGYLVPYAAVKVYKPSQNHDGLYSVEVGQASDSIMFQPMGPDQMPQALEEQSRRAVLEARESDEI